ncbi:DUF4350 domain-containing protein [Streptomyces sp. PCS3-D2]|uniref:DUF4350 domain-containing protein n=1 Tax=Streptomyces sp. PCS3-D2 TaxID=1460244 RepID=UPI000996134B|nr:DUF4350 domain-containing protein [Streptomyces sp. PCS3-D2]WKV73688.1 DUF4350 domain-containing protein [Streptomyces sp. PCS3-D2]
MTGPTQPWSTPEHPPARSGTEAAPGTGSTPGHRSGASEPLPARSGTEASAPAGREPGPSPRSAEQHAAPSSGPGPAPAPAPAAAGPGEGPGRGTVTAATPAAAHHPRRATRTARRTAAVLAVVAAGAVILAALNSGTRHGALDPRSADPAGSRAVAELLRERGVTTRVVTTAREAADAAGPGTTLLVTEPDLLGAAQRSAIRSAIDLSGGRTVLLAPGDPSLSDLSPGVRTEGDAATDDLAPRCTLPAAESAGRAGTGGGLRYSTALPGAIACYPSGGHPTLLVLPTGTTGGDTVLLGSETVLLNESLAEEGNASLALQLLGSRPDLVWYLPSLADSDAGTGSGDEDKTLFQLVPAGWSWALLQLLLAAVLAALWRARRLGPLVTERLPVAIRASETTEGRARLYRRAGARDRAATVLRAASRERLAALVGVSPAQAHEATALVPAVSARLTGGSLDVTALLFGTTPSDDAALVALAGHLDALEREVRTS